MTIYEFLDNKTLMRPNLVFQKGVEQEPTVEKMIIHHDGKHNYEEFYDKFYLVGEKEVDVRMSFTLEQIIMIIGEFEKGLYNQCKERYPEEFI